MIKEIVEYAVNRLDALCIGILITVIGALIVWWLIHRKLRKEDYLENIEKKIEEAESEYNDAIAEFNEADIKGEEEEILDELEDRIEMAKDKLLNAWEKVAYCYKRDEILRQKFKDLFLDKFEDFINEPDVKKELKKKSRKKLENIQWLKKELL